MATREKGTFGRPATVDSAELPEYLRGKQRVEPVLKNATADDYVWVGDDGGLDPTRLISELLKPRAMLEQVLLAVIDAHPDPAATRERRLSTAMKALTGTGRDAGRPTDVSYDKALALMAREYHAGFFELAEPRRSLNDLALWALRQDPDYEGWSEATRESRLRRLRERFPVEKDGLLSWQTAQDDPEVRLSRSKVERAIVALLDLGIGEKALRGKEGQ